MLVIGWVTAWCFQSCPSLAIGVTSRGVQYGSHVVTGQPPLRVNGKGNKSQVHQIWRGVEREVEALCVVWICDPMSKSLFLKVALQWPK